MARENVDLYQEQFAENQTRAVLERLRSDFDAHNHDGSNSRPLENIIARTLQVNSAIIGGHKLFEAVVGPTASDYKSVATALLAGETRIFVRNGTYTLEPKWEITNAGTIIIGESINGVDISFNDDTTANNRNIYVNATRFECGNMKLTAYDTNANDLFEFGASGSRPYIHNIIAKNKNGSFFEAGAIANLYGTFKDIYLDMTTCTAAATMIGFNTVGKSIVQNCFFDMTGLSSTYTGVNVVKNGDARYENITLYVDQSGNIPVINALNATFIGGYFYIHEIIFAANIHDCIIEGNGNAPSGYLIVLDQFGARFTKNHIIASNDTDNIFNATAAHQIITDNYFEHGKKILIDHPTVTIPCGIFSSNVWRASNASMNLEIGARCHGWNVIGNSARNYLGGGAPTFTDNGALTNSAYNQLING